MIDEQLVIIRNLKGLVNISHPQKPDKAVIINISLTIWHT